MADAQLRRIAWRPTNRAEAARLLALAVPAALLAGAYVAQYGFALYPCEMCWWQRYPHVAAILLALAALCVRRTPARLLTIAAAMAIAVSGAIGVFHAGVEYGWWQGLTTCSSLGGGSGDTLTDLLAAPLIRCDVAQWTLFGISLAGYNAILSLGGAFAVLALLRRRSR